MNGFAIGMPSGQLERLPAVETNVGAGTALLGMADSDIQLVI